MKYPEKYSLLIKIFGNSPRIRLLNVFFENPYFDFSREELVKMLGMSKSTVYKGISELEKLGIIKFSRKIGKSVLYKLNRENEIVIQLENFIRNLSFDIAFKEQEKSMVKVSAK